MTTEPSGRDALAGLKDRLLSKTEMRWESFSKPFTEMTDEDCKEAHAAITALEQENIKLEQENAKLRGDNNRLCAALDILQKAMTEGKNIPLRFKHAILDARQSLNPAVEALRADVKEE